MTDCFRSGDFIRAQARTGLLCGLVCRGACMSLYICVHTYVCILYIYVSRYVCVYVAYVQMINMHVYLTIQLSI